MSCRPKLFHKYLDVGTKRPTGATHVIAVLKLSAGRPVLGRSWEDIRLDRRHEQLPQYDNNVGIVRLVAVAGWKTDRFLKDKEDV